MHPHLNKARKVVGVAAQIGAGKIAHDIVNNNTEPKTTFDKVAYAFGAAGLAAAAARVACTEMHRRFDDIVESFEKAKAQVDKAQEESTE